MVSNLCLNAATGRVTPKVDVYAFGVVLMEIITGRKALDETMPEEKSHLVTWFRRLLVNQDHLRESVDRALQLDDETYESICKVAELAGHCTAPDAPHRPDMGHIVNILRPLVEQWRPSSEPEENGGGIDLNISLPQTLRMWQAEEGTSRLVDVSSSSDSGTRRVFDSFSSTDCR